MDNYKEKYEELLKEFEQLPTSHLKGRCCAKCKDLKN